MVPIRFLLASSYMLASMSTAALADDKASQAPGDFPSFHPINSTHLGAPARWDYVTFDPASGRVFVAHGDHTDVVDGRSGRLVGRVQPIEGAHGTVAVPEFGRGFADSSETHSVTVFDLRTLKPLTTLPVGEDADAVAYDAPTKRVFVINGDSGTVSVLDAATLKPVTTIQVGGKLESAVSDGRGAMFLNLAEAGAVARIDTAAAAIAAKWPVPGCRSPHGIGYDDETRRIFVSCVDGRMKVLDAGNGHIVDTLPIGMGSDSVAVDAKRRLVFSANGSGSLSIISIVDANHFEVRPALSTPRGARTMAVDPASGRLFLASATASNAPAAPGKHMKFVPGSLKLLTYAPD